MRANLIRHLDGIVRIFFNKAMVVELYLFITKQSFRRGIRISGLFGMEHATPAS